MGLHVDIYVMKESSGDILYGNDAPMVASLLMSKGFV